MPLFRDENPALGAQTVVKELSGTGSGTPVVNYYKPTTREIITAPLTPTAGANSQYVFQAPWTAQVLAIRFNGTTVGGSVLLYIEKITADGVAPAASNGTTIVLLTASTVALNAFTVNSFTSLPLSTASGALTLNPGDRIAMFVSGATTGMVGTVVQIELAQIG